MLGTGNFGTRWGSGAKPAEARAIFERFAERHPILLGGRLDQFREPAVPMA
ncbi:MAG TPA: hypothetical protein VHW44_30555 [Pseudonocardiaceae bacterium]|nr:hypothetical protein [Pseudonocardiaceae bacterium]